MNKTATDLSSAIADIRTLISQYEKGNRNSLLLDRLNSLERQLLNNFYDSHTKKPTRKKQPGIKKAAPESTKTTAQK